MSRRRLLQDMGDGRDLRVVLAAEDTVGAMVLGRVLARGHDVVSVVTSGRGRGLGSSVAEHARQQGLPLRPPADLRTDGFARWLRAQHVDLLLTTCSTLTVTSEVAQAPRRGSWNLHLGPLPRYAGQDAASWAVLRGEPRHGVTLHRITSSVEAGPVAFRSEFEVHERDTALTVFSTCLRDGCRLVDRLLDALERDEPVPSVTQDLSRQWCFPAGPPDGGVLDWERPAKELVAFVRACDYGPFTSPWGHPRCFLHGGAVEVLRASTTGRAAGRSPGTIGESTAAGALVAAADRWVLVEQVAVDGRRTDPAEVLPAGGRLRGARQPA